MDAREKYRLAYRLQREYHNTIEVMQTQRATNLTESALRANPVYRAMQLALKTIQDQQWELGPQFQKAARKTILAHLAQPTENGWGIPQDLHSANAPLWQWRERGGRELQFRNGRWVDYVNPFQLPPTQDNTTVPAGAGGSDQRTATTEGV